MSVLIHIKLDGPESKYYHLPVVHLGWYKWGVQEYEFKGHLRGQFGHFMLK